jgi:hypothetical protein
MTAADKKGIPRGANPKDADPRGHNRAVHDPASTFDTPMDLVQTPKLPLHEKERALETWAEDEKALQRATEEGMGGGERPRLREVKKAEQALEERAGSAAKPKG